MSSTKSSGFIGRLVEQAKKRLSCFVLVGLLNTVIGYGLFALIYFVLGAVIGFIGAILVTHVLATSIGYLNLSKLTFSDSHSSFAWLKYQFFYLIPLITNLILVPVMIDVFDMNTYLAQGLFTIIYGVFAYFYHLVITFRTTREPEKK